MPTQEAFRLAASGLLASAHTPACAINTTIERLGQRGLNCKFSLAMRELAPGLERLARFVERQPLRKGHECALGVLALESEPVDPRLYYRGDWCPPTSSITGPLPWWPNAIAIVQ